ncbi:hypothetical protein CORC01_06225 [Colletotrichum orchidophilum]|uniref:Uncharacterized protein n=1 Tax=Colletotrichum orchidophilum TaxID=1209926 RepID=A0A1G4BAK3_9PEZI|nr:uncharacterized protein CORC01_06225 [Colletotrichum orchidophilum]OHE98434.1 hypothetical protein CORC01_06225 [Colletotrichum orchidophilum]
MYLFFFHLLCALCWTSKVTLLKAVHQMTFDPPLPGQT